MVSDSRIFSILAAFAVCYFVKVSGMLAPDTFHGPDSNNIKKKTWHDKDGTCFRMIPQPYVCPLI